MGPKSAIAAAVCIVAVAIVHTQQAHRHLARRAAITGVVLDDYGAPVPLVRVVAERRIVADGRVRFEQQTSAETDDAGQFRLFGLNSGDYVVGVSGVRIIWAAGRPPLAVAADTPPGEYYPAVPRADRAQIIAVHDGAEVSGINFTVHVPPPPIPPQASNETRRRAAGVIRGRITRADGLPLKRARVELSSADRLFAPLSTLADDDGNYAFVDLAAGRYLVAATSTGFMMGTYRQRRASDRGDVILVSAGATAEHIDVSVPATSAIVGRVVDEYGDPVENANVHLEQVRWSAGRLRALGVSGVVSRQTDDLGRFRIFSLLPGRYVVSAIVGQPLTGVQTNDLPGYVKSYFAGAYLVTDAQIVDVAPGQDALNVDFPLVRGVAGSISGRVFRADGHPFEGAVHLIASYRSGAIATAPARTRAEDGAFTFDHLTPGEYVVQAATARQNRSTEGEFGVQFVTVSAAGVAETVIRMSTGSSVTGRITFEGGGPPANAEVALAAVPADVDLVSLADNPVARAQIHEDWTFEMHGLNGPRRLRPLETPDGWRLESIRVNGADVTDVPLGFAANEQSISNVEVVLTNRTTEIAGTVVDDRDRATADATVVVFPTDRTRWYAQSRFIVHTGVSSDATFDVRGLPPGDYYIAAIDSRDAPEEPDDIENPEFLRAITTSARRITVVEGQRATATLRVLSR